MPGRSRFHYRRPADDPWIVVDRAHSQRTRTGRFRVDVEVGVGSSLCAPSGWYCVLDLDQLSSADHTIVSRIVSPGRGFHLESDPTGFTLTRRP